MHRPGHTLRRESLPLLNFPSFSRQLVLIGLDQTTTIMRSNHLNHIPLNGEVKVFHIVINPWIDTRNVSILVKKMEKMALSGAQVKITNQVLTWKMENLALGGAIVAALMYLKMLLIHIVLRRLCPTSPLNLFSFLQIYTNFLIHPFLI